MAGTLQAPAGRVRGEPAPPARRDGGSHHGRCWPGRVRADGEAGSWSRHGGHSGGLRRSPRSCWPGPTAASQKPDNRERRPPGALARTRGLQHRGHGHGLHWCLCLPPTVPPDARGAPRCPRCPPMPAVPPDAHGAPRCPRYPQMPTVPPGYPRCPGCPRCPRMPAVPPDAHGAPQMPAVPPDARSAPRMPAVPPDAHGAPDARGAPRCPRCPGCPRCPRMPAPAPPALRLHLSCVRMGTAPFPAGRPGCWRQRLWTRGEGAGAGAGVGGRSSGPPRRSPAPQLGPGALCC
uniref:Uncharacterized protein n=1 Tax=Pipistrellus kuhlii TaxID=59472 RepID=A0A7J7WDL5_PIPKU|nr:hypothetical protein mPipKuh1_008108 [Pipistrellus kuhlii]